MKLTQENKHVMARLITDLKCSFKLASFAVNPFYDSLQFQLVSHCPLMTSEHGFQLPEFILGKFHGITTDFVWKINGDECKTSFISSGAGGIGVKTSDISVRAFTLHRDVTELACEFSIIKRLFSDLRWQKTDTIQLFLSEEHQNEVWKKVLLRVTTTFNFDMKEFSNVFKYESIVINHVMRHVSSLVFYQPVRRVIHQVALKSSRASEKRIQQRVFITGLSLTSNLVVPFILRRLEVLIREHRGHFSINEINVGFSDEDYISVHSIFGGKICFCLRGLNVLFWNSLVRNFTFEHFGVPLKGIESIKQRSLPQSSRTLSKKHKHQLATKQLPPLPVKPRRCLRKKTKQVPSATLKKIFKTKVVDLQNVPCSRQASHKDIPTSEQQLEEEDVSVPEMTSTHLLPEPISFISFAAFQGMHQEIYGNRIQRRNKNRIVEFLVYHIKTFFEPFTIIEEIPVGALNTNTSVFEETRFDAMSRHSLVLPDHGNKFSFLYSNQSTQGCASMDAFVDVMSTRAGKIHQEIIDSIKLNHPHFFKNRIVMSQKCNVSTEDNVFFVEFSTDLTINFNSSPDPFAGSQQQEVSNQQLEGDVSSQRNEVSQMAFMNSGIVRFGGLSLNYLGIRRRTILVFAHLFGSEMTQSHYNLRIYRLGLWYNINVPIEAITLPDLYTSSLYAGRPLRPDYALVDLSSCSEIPFFLNIMGNFISEVHSERMVQRAFINARSVAELDLGFCSLISALDLVSSGTSLIGQHHVSFRVLNYRTLVRSSIGGSPILATFETASVKILGLHRVIYANLQASGEIITFEMINRLLMSQPESSRLVSELKQLEEFIESNQFSRPVNFLARVDDECVVSRKVSDSELAGPSQLAILYPQQRGELTSATSSFNNNHGERGFQHNQQKPQSILNRLLDSRPKRVMTSESIIRDPCSDQPFKKRLLTVSQTTSRLSGSVGNLVASRLWTSPTPMIPNSISNQLQKFTGEIKNIIETGHKELTSYFVRWIGIESPRKMVTKTRLVTTFDRVWLLVSKKYPGVSLAGIVVTFRILPTLAHELHRSRVLDLINHSLRRENFKSTLSLETLPTSFKFDSFYNLAWTAASWLIKEHPEVEFGAVVEYSISPMWRLHFSFLNYYFCLVGAFSGIYVISSCRTVVRRPRECQILLDHINQKVLDVIGVGENTDLIDVWRVLLQEEFLDAFCEVVNGGNSWISNPVPTSSKIRPSVIAYGRNDCKFIRMVEHQRMDHGIYETPASANKSMQFAKVLITDAVENKRKEKEKEFKRRAFHSQPSFELLNWMSEGSPPVENLQDEGRAKSGESTCNHAGPTGVDTVEREAASKRAPHPL